MSIGRSSLAWIASHAEVISTVVSLTFIASSSAVALARVTYPHELEFMGGAMLDLVERMSLGQPLYGPPSLHGTPFVYGPGWYVVMRAISCVLPRAIPLRLAARLIAFMASAWTATLVFRLTVHSGASRGRAIQCVGVFACGYVVTDFWYDLERVDALAMALAVTGVWASSRRGTSSLTLAAVAFVCGMLVKQQVFLVAAGTIVGLLCQRKTRTGVVLTACLMFLSIAAAIVVDRWSGGWARIYCVGIPGEHGIQMYRVQYLVRDLLFGMLFTVGTATCICRALQRSREAVFLVGPLIGAFVAAALSRLHSGGWPNVMMTWFALAALSVGMLPRVGRGGLLTAAAIVTQLAICGVRLPSGLPTTEQESSEHRLAAIVRALERAGPVLIHGRGHVSRERYYHSVALQDWYRSGRGTWSELESATVERRFAAIVLDSLEELMMDPSGHLLTLVANHYRVAGQLAGLKRLPSGFPAVPTWVLEPRPTPLRHDRETAGRLLQEEAAAVERSPWHTEQDIVTQQRSCDD